MVTFKLVFRYELMSKGRGNTERWVEKTLDLMDHPDLHNEPLRDRRENAHKYLTEATFWANLRIAYAHIDADHVRLDLAKSYVEFSEHEFFRTVAIEPEDLPCRLAPLVEPLCQRLLQKIGVAPPLATCTLHDFLLRHGHQTHP